MRLALVSLALFAAVGASAQSVLLRYQPPVGKTVSYTMTNAMSMTSPMAPGKPMAFTQTIPMTVRVVSKTAAGTMVETKSGPTKMSAPAGSPMAGMANNPAMRKVNVVRITIDPFGTPKGATGAGPAAAMANSMGSVMGGGSQGVFFPAKPIKVGDTWTSAMDLGKMAPAGMPMKMNGKIPLVYRLVSLKGGVAMVAMTAKGTMSMAFGNKPMQIAMDIRSTILLDASTGLTKSMSSVTDSTTTLPGMGAMRQHMASTMR